MKKTVLFLALMMTVVMMSTAVAAEEIAVVGTGSGMPLLKAVADAFNRNQTEVRIVVPESMGSSGGIKAVGTDQYKIGRIARPIKDTEKHYGLTAVPVARMPIVFFTNKNGSVENLTAQQICRIYSGEITNWKDAGGKDEAIRVIRREDGDSSLKVLQKDFPGFKGIDLTQRSKTTFTNRETAELAEKTTGTIAWGDYIDTQNYDVRALSIDGKKPTDSDYPYTGILSLIFKKENLTGAVQKFVEFAKSSEAHDAVITSGGLPAGK